MRAADGTGVRWSRVSAHGSGRQLRKNLRQLLLEIAQTAGVLYSVGGPRGFFGLCQLAGGPFVEGFVPACAGALGADRLVGDDAIVAS